MTNDAPAEPSSLWPSLPTLIKSSFYSDKHSHVIYIETMPRPGLWGEIYINYSNPLPSPPSTSTTVRVWKMEIFSSDGLKQSSPAQSSPSPWSRLPVSCLSMFAGLDCVDCRYWQIFRERPPPCVNMLYCCTAALH